MPKAVHDLAKKLQGEGKSEDSSWAIAQSALKEMNKKPFPPFDVVQPGEKQKEAIGLDKPPATDLDRLEQEAVAISGGLSAQGVGAKRHEDQKLLETICECDSFNKVHEALLQEADEDIDWITVRGSRIPIKKGENKDEAVKKFLADKGGAKPKAKASSSSNVSDMSEKELVSSIKGGSKDWKDWSRTSKNEKEYAEIERRNKAIPYPKTPEGAGGKIFQDDPNAIEKYEKKIKHLEDVGDYWKKITKFPHRDYENHHQLGDEKWFAMTNNSQLLNGVRKSLAKVKERKESGTTLERKVTYKHGKPRFYYKENPKEQETIGSNASFDYVLNALRKETK